MTTKVPDSPTINLFSLLAEEQEEEAQAKRAAARVGSPSAKGSELREQTPKERAAAKAVQEAEKKAKREAEKAKREAEDERLRLLELRDDTGFGQQRHQRIKESRVHEQPPVPEEKPKKEGNKSPKGPKGPKPKGPQAAKTTGQTTTANSGSNKDDNAWGVSSPKSTEKGIDGKGFAKGGAAGAGGAFPKEKKQFQERKGGEGAGRGFKAPRADGETGGRPPKRDFDRHSAGTGSRQPYAKKGGHGVGNWGTEVGTPSGEQWSKGSTEAEDAHVAVADWGEATPVTDDTTKTTGDAADPSTTPDAAQKGKDKDEDSNKLTLEEWAAKEEERRKAFDAMFPSAQPRQLSDEEKKALGKFKIVDNPKFKAQKAPSTTTTTTTTTAATTAPSAPTGGRKGEKVVALEDLNFRVSGGPTRGRGRGRGFGGRPEFSPKNTQPRRTGTQKLPQNFEAAFPTLG